ncbi:MAG: phosphatidylserine decarboxylase family protein [Candidatus Marinimicrobia bacterium]|jgi:phosphatidylserine decarboxylase|nr:phosphatidylserine decarboxylase family protein [Candidatus Neomarinimicrobiota bacterium]MDP6456101.1 phosphatidylserine decarboxylase family protein [Candidatus Neomarinimicrobiota bacterium]MDP6592885.1 phosphatidylserine decarboxylase family protein [Candidatus Neomarinimicrobiota bacterium]MDP6836158.1 phosphatidylserine decarboxylase family protein [Candidatus Neomarinimicrobiota bacterium]MDP6967161.1 phosphatidylserine decarboxylase family protein [Candidatus Neomarinimicrobiota bact|tara:strand:- start:5771 stop:6406 length:636 start_codon:yes stop_codon:yes gene_type:complete
MLAPEGKSIIAGVVLVTVVFALGGWTGEIPVLKVLAIICLPLLVLCLIFFRDPDRITPPGENLILSPADGKVVFVGSERGSEGEAMQVSIFLSIFDVHANRVPVSGLVKKVLYSKGRFLAAFKDEASRANEHTEIHIVTGESLIRVKQIAGVVARRIICYLKEGDEVSRGDRLGYIRFGSRTDIIVPADAKIHVNVGQKVVGGQSVIGELL